MKRIWNHKATTVLFAILIFSLLFTGCKKEEEEEVETEATADTPTLSMGLPDSLTGGKKSQSQQGVLSVVNAVNAIEINQAESGESGPCDYTDDSSSDAFRNGYTTTKFLVRISETWSCIADQFMAIGKYESAFNDQYFITSKEKFSGAKLTKDSATRKTIRLYYNGPDESPGWYFTWDRSETGITGKIIIAFSDTDSTDDVENLRIDFNKTSDSQSSEFFIEYKSTQINELNGFRALITKDLTVAETDEKRIVAKGLLDFAGQPYSTGASVPNSFKYKVYTISDQEGTGAARASIENLGITLEFPQDGNYIFTRDDWYLFTSEGDSEYVKKEATTATWIDGTTELTGCITTGVASAACAADFNLWYTNDTSGWEQNSSGSVPTTDPRYMHLLTVENGLGGPTYFSSVYPDAATDWTGGFEMTP